MRRCIHSFLVGLLTLSTSMDAARACWHLRRGGHGSRHAAVVCPPCVPAPVVWPSVDACAEVVEDGCAGWQLVSDVVVHEAVVEGAVTLGGAAPMAAAEGVVVGEAVAPPVPTPAAVAAPTAVADGVPELQPAEPPVEDDVRQTAAIDEPVMQPAAPVEPVAAPAEAAVEPAPEEPPMASEPPAPAPAPVEENIFDEVDRAAETASEAGGVPPVEAPVEPAQGTADEAPVSADEPAAAAEEPAPTPETEEPSAPPADAARRPPLEPSRRWIDRSGQYAIVGALRDVRDDGVCVIESTGRMIEVPLESLSEFDRDYAAAAGRGRLGSPQDDAPGPALARH